MRLVRMKKNTGHSEISENDRKSGCVYGSTGKRTSKKKYGNSYCDDERSSATAEQLKVREKRGEQNEKQKSLCNNFCGVAVAMNIVLGIITSALGIPLYLDTLGTVLSAAILGQYRESL